MTQPTTVLEPLEVPATRTPIATLDLRKAVVDRLTAKLGRAPSPATIVLFVAHSALETGWWASCYAWNLGNVKATAGVLHCYRSCGEEVTASTYAALMAGPLATCLAVVREYTRGNTAMVSLAIAPRHSWSRFQAWTSLASALADHFALLERGFPEAWAELLGAADPAKYATALHQRGYFTADVANYAAGLVSVAAMVRAQLAKADGPAPAPVPNVVTLPAPPPGKVWVHASEATDEQLREYAASTYRPLAGLSAAPGTREAYLDAIGHPGITAAMRAAMAGMWSCALLVDGEDERMLALAPPDALAHAHWLIENYVTGNAMTDEERTADLFHALHYAAKEPAARPQKGDHVIQDAAGTAHTFSITSDPDASGAFRTVEGGEVDAQGFKAIEAGARVLLPGGVLTSPDRKAHHALWAWVNVVELLRNAGAWVLVDAVAKAPVPVDPAAPPAPTTADVAAPMVLPPPRSPMASRAFLALCAASAASTMGWLTDHPRIAIGAMAIMVALVVLFVVAEHFRRHD